MASVMITSELRRRFRAEENPDAIIYINNGVSIESKLPLNIDFDSIFASDRDEPPLELIIVPSASAGDGDQCRRSPAKKKKQPIANSSSSLDVVAGGDDLALISAHELKSAIERKVCTIASCGENLPDKGAKLKAQLRRLEDELELRKQNSKVLTGGARPLYVTPAPPCQGGFWRVRFGVMFWVKVWNKTGDQAINAYENEISYLNLYNKLKRKSVVQIPQSKRTKPALCSKQLSSSKPNKLSRSSGKYMSLDGFLARADSIGSLPKERLAGSFTMKDASETLNLNGSKNEKDLKQGQTVVLVDEEEPEHADAERKQEAEELSLRDDPESLEIFHSELKCLECGKCLTSTITNFYIRFLQEFPPQRSQPNFYFFNTYFYSKLQAAVAYKNSGKEAFFIKFRRWWKGVNIFQKAYVFLPINEDLLKNEWEYLSQGNAVLDIPISDRIWKHLPHTIDQKIVTAYVCRAEAMSSPRTPLILYQGRLMIAIVVLYYMERFVQAAPDRLKKQAFDDVLFKPREASSLRWRIKTMLQEEFRKAPREGNSMSQPLSLP
ncbi:hypothetical protein Cgig2_018276 [Carnegiea gigantea]|uniref:Ubiquitin-like protease family profile domain-containing protein n=1 Tax=Carnegiea gigantea TaxID=171969 RepID=A0A9Q1KXT4_9CARY|nr:hypothetical protein Cgig2_018276 [Carnegiea gigantea]